MGTLAEYINGMQAHSVVLITSLYPPFPEGVQQLWGGVEIDLEDSVKSLQKLGIDSSIIAFHYIEPIEDTNNSIKRIGIYYPYLLGKSYRSTASFAYKEFFRPLIFLKLIGALRKEKPDLVIIGKTYQFSLAIYVACMLLRLPYVVRYDWSCPTNPKPEVCSFRDRFRCAACVEKTTGMRIPTIAKLAACLYFVPLFLLKRFFWNRSEKVLVVSEFYQRFMESFGLNPDKIGIIPPGSELTVNEGKIRELEKEFKSKGEFILLYVGRLEPEKGITFLLDAFKEIKEEQVKLLIAGTGRLKDLVTGAAEVDQRISYLGLIPHEQIGDYYAIADLVVIPSIVPEGHPVVAEEAISLNKPILGSNMGGLAEMLGKYEKGISLDEINTIKLQKAIQGFINVRVIR